MSDLARLKVPTTFFRRAQAASEQEPRWSTADKGALGPPRSLLAGERRAARDRGGPVRAQRRPSGRLCAKGRVANLAAYPGQRRTKWSRITSAASVRPVVVNLPKRENTKKTVASLGERGDRNKRWPTADKKPPGRQKHCFALASSGGQRRT